MARPKSDTTISPAARSALHRKTNEQRGGRQLSTIQLGPEDATKLAEIKAARGIATDATMIRLILREAFLHTQFKTDTTSAAPPRSRA